MIPVERAHVHVAAGTHPGMKGKNNEDRYSVSAYHTGEKNSLPSVLAVVSDGIGGHRAGEVAAEMAVEIISKTIAESGVEKPTATLEEAIVNASQAIWEISESDPEKRGMGATCACAWIIGNRLYTASVGDSRIYLIRSEIIRKLTTDHTWVQEAIEFGALTPDQARSHPNAHVIRRYLGSPQPPAADFRVRLNPDEPDEQAIANQGLRLVSGDQLLLCSDGLTDLVDDAEILAALKTKPQQEAVDGLIDLANERGGHDNITIVALDIPRRRSAVPASAVPTPAGTRRILPFTLSCLALGLLVFMGLALAGGAYWFLNQPTSTSTQTATVTSTVEPFPTPSPFTSRTPDQLATEPPLFPVPGASPTPRTTRVLLPTYTAWPTSTQELQLPPIATLTPSPTLVLP